MRALTYKIIPDRTVLTKLTSHYASLRTIHTSIKIAYKEYVLKKASPSIIPLVVTTQQKDDFEKAYSNKPTKAGLDWISSIYINGLSSCPFCGGDGGRTIEHFLPQASYPEFSVYSLNLMPSCASCNSQRNSLNSHGAEIKLLHPFFDKVILKKLDAYTHISFASGVIGFNLVYDRAPFDDEQQERIDHHLNTSLDETSYINRSLSSLETLTITAELYKDVPTFMKHVIEEEIYTCVRKKDFNSWHHALCKGVTRLPVAQILAIFSPHFGRRC
ncbi:hypothetical protein [Pseudomonas sp. GXZC]|uniref:hypothetical protein n=1 Tax=Pseudomonas sp. GXZC TaxID=3003351 RepID=UPI0022AB354F|nr:hypothetical protein [Pseudomonas sp. GXZC]WAT31831.1 hypothetical protein OZ428_16250 [Pseudomonas sp. GXZC]